ncbi:uncharacterized protein [Littorina saxatilis]|uniref:GH10 domain-containing protein n=1 Tax=Littorina saxatilis TaxID=31220 RepID=A0AAN9GD67_9CAEN
MLLNFLLVLSSLLICASAKNLLINAGFESTDHWDCPHMTCTLSSTAHSGHHSLQITHRQNGNHGAQQTVHLTPGHNYHVRAFVKLLTQVNHNGEDFVINFYYKMTDGSTKYPQAAHFEGIKKSDGWVDVSGVFGVDKNVHLQSATLQIHGGSNGVDFLVDDATIDMIAVTPNEDWRKETDAVIDKIRKSDIHVQVTNKNSLHLPDVSVQLLQTKKSFPWGMSVRDTYYNKNAVNGKYRDFVHKHFTWATVENGLKWHTAEPVKGQKDYQPALDTLHGLRSHGIKVRGHNLVWSTDKAVQSWVKALSGQTLRNTVQHHIQEVMNLTHGLVEHWDVNNENLHGQWYQDRLHDPDYDLELFRIAHHNDPHVKLFLNDFGVISKNLHTQEYLQQALRFKATNVGLYGMGVQCHFFTNPDPYGIKERLDVLAKAGVPMWATEVDVVNDNENVRADYLEMAIRSLYGHPAIEGIVFWGFWDKEARRGEAMSWVKGDHMEMTAAGRRAFDLLENQFMTDSTHRLSSASHFSVRGFHGDYEVHVHYKGHELHNATQKFTLGTQEKTIHITL